MQTVTQRTRRNGDAPKSPTIMVSFRCPRDVKRALKDRAHRDEVSVQDLCIAALRSYLGLVEEAA